ncbi:hypothetical protein OE88DRAFT_1634585 [Heliocybe sulcata]|uniref:DUF6570 domain-containing protein n=1 Tax=Heliocybe sulcata TaxID=5364 RepID=A0A5C3MSS9_9AGAM|nr:hypothetical protein OE88DRAFT_1634585 [Heliocybe sulcata]
MQEQTELEPSFPPDSLPRSTVQQIMRNFSMDQECSNIEEAGCGVCGILYPVLSMSNLKDFQQYMHLLCIEDRVVSRIERTDASDLIRPFTGPILATDCDKICPDCVLSLNKSERPTQALANGLWLGNVPTSLQELTLAEKMLVARVRHNRCVVRVASGGLKMRANAIMFSNPTPKIYDVLPPPKQEMDEVLAFIFTGPTRPTEEEFRRTPMLVSHKRVTAALEWLKLNHSDYQDLTISYENIKEYKDNSIPVVMSYHQSNNPTGDSLGKGLDFDGNDHGTQAGSCPLVSIKALKAIAMKHLTNTGKVLAVGHADQPESIYNNPQLYPQMFPWLFPYGLGGLGNNNGYRPIPEKAHKKWLLMYYDKRFQLDQYFPIIAFNQEQIKASTTGGFLVAERNSFDDITQ